MAQTFEKNRPINPKKALFFDSLVEFYTSTISTSEKQLEIEDAISAFMQKGSYLKPYDISNVKVLNQDVVEKFTPTHRRKIALYSALVSYMEDKMGACLAQNEDEEDVEKALQKTESIFPDFAIVAIFAPAYKQYTEKNEKKTYYVNVHFDVVVPVRVTATSEEEAISKAKDIADVDNYDDVTLSDACVTDVE